MSARARVRNVAHQFLNLEIADAHAEVFAGDVLYLVGFVEDHRRVGEFARKSCASVAL